MFSSDKQPTVVTISSMTFVKIIIVLLVIGFVWLIRDVLFLLLISIVLAAAFDPWVDWFQKKKIPRAVSILVIYIILIGLFSMAVGLMVPVVVEQLSELTKNLPGYLTHFSSWFSDLQKYFLQYGVLDDLTAVLTNWQSSLGQSTGGLFSLLGGVFGGLFSLFSVMVMTFYMIIEEDNTKKFIKSICPKKFQGYLVELMDRISIRMGYWLRGQLILSFVVGLLVYIGLSILGIKYAFVLALIAAVTEIIPYVGPIIGAIPGVLLAFTVSPITGVFAIIIYFTIQQLENSFLTPRIMSKASGLNPVIVILAILVGAKMGGPVGAIIAIPVAIILSIFLKGFMEHPKQYKGEG